MTHMEVARRTRKLSQIELAKFARVNVVLIRLLEKQRAIPNDDQLDRLAQVLGVPADRLLTSVVTERAAASV